MHLLLIQSESPQSALRVFVSLVEGQTHAHSSMPLGTPPTHEEKVPLLCPQEQDLWLLRLNYGCPQPPMHSSLEESAERDSSSNIIMSPQNNCASFTQINWAIKHPVKTKGLSGESLGKVTMFTEGTHAGKLLNSL